MRGIVFERTHVIKYLGIYSDTGLIFQTYIANTLNSASDNLGYILFTY